MRLLKYAQPPGTTTSITFRLTEFLPSNIPPVYAILSHRWASDEVTLKDLESGNGNAKEGYKKLEFCAEQAARDGIVYFWVDTCCIDKANYTELSEAINSMYKWYKNATKCYVYMSDVSIPDQLLPVNTQDDWKAAFRDSAWFTRGWTLQELIAPSSVEFYSREVKRIGDKKSLEQEIEQITGIPSDALNGAPLSRFDIDERLTWAARRVTTVEEDAAYCLLGLFDVHMPLIYGEGRQKALDRLRREIQLSNDSTASLAANVAWIVPFERNSHFVGRGTELATLERQLFAQDRTSRWAVTGLGGVGKTQLVIELLHRIRLKYRDCLVLWIPAVTSEGLHQGYASVARQLNLPGSDEENTDAVELVRDHLNNVSTGRWILVFDNADDIDLWTSPRTSEHKRSAHGQSSRLIDHFPQNKRGCIIFTTRSRKAATRLAGSNIIPVSALDKVTAMDMLRQYLADPGLVDDAEVAAKLLTELAYLPLAIVQAAAYINANGYSLGDYLELLDEKEEEVVSLLSENFEAEGRYYDFKNPIATTWLISFEHIRYHDRLAADYLAFMACIHHKDIPQSLLPPGPSRRKEMEAIGTLTAYSFVERRSADSALDLHRLVHLATRNWLRKESLLSQWQEKTCAHLDKVFPNNDHQNRSIWRIYMPHALCALKPIKAGEIEGRNTSLMRRCAKCLYRDGRWNEAEALFTQISASQKMILISDASSLLTNTAWLAATYRKQGRLAEAEELEVQIVEARKSKLGVSHLETLASMHNLASTYRSQGRWTEAEDLDLQVTEARKNKLGADHPDTLTCMNNLASTYSAQGRWTEAEELEVQVLETRKSKLGLDHPSTLTTMSNLALTYWKQGRWTEAEELELQAMETRKVKLGLEHPNTVTSMHNLAYMWYALGRNAEAIQLMRMSVERKSRVFGTSHPSFGDSSKILRKWEAEKSEAA